MKTETKKKTAEMMKFITRKIIPLLVLALTFQACLDELDQINPNALTNGSFWQNAGDLNAGLNATYAALRDENILGITWETTRTDICVPFSQRSNVTGNPIYDQSFDLSTNEVQNKWDACYLGIFRANQVLDAYYNLQETFTTETAIESGLRIEAQARAIRGYLYYVLHTNYNYGSVPLFTSVPKVFEDFQKTFATADAVKEFYRAELKYGIENLPGTYNAWQSDVGNGNLGRVTGGFCEALLAKSYMNENNFTEAKPYLENVMNNYDYALVDDLSKCFTGISEFNSESIFEINYSNTINPLGLDEQQLSQRISNFLNNGNRVQPTSWLALKYRDERPDPLDPANLVDRNTYLANGDLDSVQVGVVRMYSKRMGNSMSSVDDRDEMMYGVESAQYGSHIDASPHAKQFANFWKKFTSWNTANGGSGEDESADGRQRGEINIPVIRLAEIYLLYAEVMIEEGNNSEALRYINRIRKRSHLILLGKSSDGSAEFAGAQTTYDELTYDKAALTEHLRFTEKPLELALEAERTTDLRRWGVWKETLQKIAIPDYDAWHFRNNRMGKNPTRWRCFITPRGEYPADQIVYNDPLVPIYPLRILDNPNTPNDESNVNGNRRTNEAHLKDHLTGSVNFIEELHSYLPVPQDEINSNLKWDQ
ncbi:RagB/SusD family nutrient uptake outer membrane protein [Flavicella sediminum]|uniref:RagB/SusD family nutrient uptake outer membrane protein n=1 Tax=Flavicella sediminum TaxID=2585141 RepID=UPI00140AF661|nr:RagB/SusD family nutrient uptake outer membrane protein [Flavicella sediminum]